MNKAGRTVIFFYEDGSRGRDVLTNFIGDAELKSVMSDGYNAYVFIGDGLKAVKENPNLQKTIHQVCLAYLKARFDKASGLAGNMSADIFLELIAFFYRRERQYDDEGAEMVATYHSIINTVKMQGGSALEYLGKFFSEIFNG